MPLCIMTVSAFFFHEDAPSPFKEEDGKIDQILDTKLLLPIPC